MGPSRAEAQNGLDVKSCPNWRLESGSPKFLPQWTQSWIHQRALFSHAAPDSTDMHSLGPIEPLTIFNFPRSSSVGSKMTIDFSILYLEARTPEKAFNSIGEAE